MQNAISNGIRWPIVGLLVALLLWYGIMPASGYFNGFLAYFSVGEMGTNYYTVGLSSPQILFSVGSLPANNIADFTLVATVAAIAPGVLLIGLIILSFWMVWRSWSQKDMVMSGVYALIALVLIGLTVFIGGPLMIQGFDYILWGSW